MRAEGDLRVERPALAAAARREAEPVDPHHAERVLHARGRRRQALLGQAAALFREKDLTEVARSLQGDHAQRYKPSLAETYCLGRRMDHPKS